MNVHFNSFKKQITNSFKYKFFLLKNLPLGFICGLKIIELDEEKASVTVQFKWVNKNPFKSIYFAVLSMAAELSTGVLGVGMMYKSQPKISMLIVKLNGEFYKKAIGKITFTCNDGDKISQAIEQAINSGEATTIDCVSVGVNATNEVVARFVFTWSFKAKKN
jgi:hypothetical protein